MGSKTTVWCYAANVWRINKKQKGGPYKKIWVVPAGVRITSAMKRDARRRQAPLYIVPQKYVEQVKTMAKTETPSTGIVGLWTTIQRYKTPIFVTGFNGFKIGKTLHYYSQYIRQRPLRCHNGKKERSFLRRLKRLGKIIVL